MNGLKNIEHVLRHQDQEINVPPELAARALRPLQRMLDFNR
ncbi:MAG: hypothetical protein ACPHRE_01070 [Pseudomonadales bacterium]